MKSISVISSNLGNGGSQRAGSDYKLLRICCWCVVLALGATDAWAARFTMYPDGVAYLDVGDALWHGDWLNAISAYWSPLYPWILGFFLKVFKPSEYWEYPLVHLVNFLNYVATFACFEFFLNAFIERQKERNPASAEQTELGLPVWTWYIAGYSLFASSSLLLITVRFPSGDMLVAAVIYLASAMILKIRKRTGTRATFARLGLVLGIGYLAKTVMLLMSAPFFAVAAALQWSVLRKLCNTDKEIRLRLRKREMMLVAVSVLVFIVTISPFVLLLSVAKGRPTFGDSGKINYEMSVNAVQFFIPQDRAAKHPVARLSALPDAFAYAHPISGTYPLWFDPTYWHAGIQPHFNLSRQLRTLMLSVLMCYWISFNLFLGLNITTAIAILYLVAPSILRCLAYARLQWELWIPGFAGIVLYSLVVIEARYVASLFCLLWLVALSGVRLPSSVTSRRAMAGVILAMAATTCLLSGWQSSRALRGIDIAEKHIATPNCWKVASELHARGTKPGDKIAVVATWLVPDQEASYVARLARVQIVAEARPEGFWAADAATRFRFANELVKIGATAILAYKPPRIEDGWQSLAGTDYYLYHLRSSIN